MLKASYSRSLRPISHNITHTITSRVFFGLKRLSGFWKKRFGATAAAGGAAAAAAAAIHNIRINSI